MFEQKLPFAALMNAVQGGGKHQGGTWQKQAEQDLIGKGGAFDMTIPCLYPRALSLCAPPLLALIITNWKLQLHI